MAAQTCLQLFGNSRTGLIHDFPSDLENLYILTNGLLGTPESIIKNHTVLPYYLPFKSEQLQIDAIQAMKRSGITSLKFRLGILTSRFRANHPLKACPECMKADIQNYGTAYWHVSHQYPGGWICLEHQIPLLEAIDKSTGVGRFLWLLPDSRILRHRLKERKEVFSEINQYLLILSKNVINMTRHLGDRSLDPSLLVQTYRNALIERQFITDGGSLRLNSISGDYFCFISHFQNIPEFELLPNSEEDAAIQLARLLRPPRTGTHPLRHHLIISWLYGDWGQFWEAYQNTHRNFGQKYEKHVERKSAQNGSSKRKIFLALLKEGDGTLRKAAIQVGIEIATAQAWAAKAGIASKRRPKKLKASMFGALITDLGNGMEKSAAALRYNVSIPTITRVLRTEVGLYEKWIAAKGELVRISARTKWEKVKLEYAELGVKAMRSQQPAVYAWLYRNDRAWLNQSVQDVSGIKRQAQSVVDWQKRDLTLSKEIERIASEIALDRPNQPIALWQLYQKMPELKPRLSCLEKLPLTRMTIDHVAKKARKRKRQ